VCFQEGFLYARGPLGKKRRPQQPGGKKKFPLNPPFRKDAVFLNKKKKKEVLGKKTWVPQSPRFQERFPKEENLGLKRTRSTFPKNQVERGHPKLF